MVKNLIRISLVVICVASIIISCGAEEKKHNAEEPYYYKSFNAYVRPFLPTDEISSEETLKLKAYIVVYYDMQNRIVSFSKYIDEELFIGVKYFYHKSGSLKYLEGFNSAGIVTISYYDEKGNKVVNRKQYTVKGEELKRYMKIFEKSKDKGNVSILDKFEEPVIP